MILPSEDASTSPWSPRGLFRAWPPRGSAKVVLTAGTGGALVRTTPVVVPPNPGAVVRIGCRCGGISRDHGGAGHDTDRSARCGPAAAVVPPGPVMFIAL